MKFKNKIFIQWTIDNQMKRLFRDISLLNLAQSVQALHLTYCPLLKPKLELDRASLRQAELKQGFQCPRLDWKALYQRLSLGNSSGAHGSSGCKTSPEMEKAIL